MSKLKSTAVHRYVHTCASHVVAYMHVCDIYICTYIHNIHKQRGDATALECVNELLQQGHWYVRVAALEALMEVSHLEDA